VAVVVVQSPPCDALVRARALRCRAPQIVESGDEGGRVRVSTALMQPVAVDDVAVTVNTARAGLV
jgi:hypothetical protein